MSRRRFSGLHNKYLKQQHELMTSFGYELAEWSKGDRGGHPIYARAGFDDMELSSTPRSERNARRALLVELRRRHPEHPLWKSMQKRKAKRGGSSRQAEQRQARARALVRAGERAVSARAVATPNAPLTRTGCIDCGRPWLSELDPTGRDCPQCGGLVMSPPKEASV